MKKISLFVCAISLATFATAQEAVQNVNELRTPTQRKINFVDVEQNQPMTFEPFNAESVAKQKAAAVEYYASDYYYTDGMMHAGVASNFYGWAPMILLPYQDEVVWHNALGATDWMVNNQTYATGTDSYTANYGVNGVYYLPQTKAHTLTFEIDTVAHRDTTVNISGYIYAEGEEDQFLTVAYHGDENIVMTLCGMYTDTINGGDGNDFYRIGAGDAGSYSYGTGLKVSTGKTADTIGVIVRNLGVMKLEQINIPVYNASKSTAAIIPANGNVKLTIYAADLTQGAIYTNEVLAETTITAKDLVVVNNQGVATLVAKFYETNILGVENQVPVVIGGDFYVELTNFNETKCDFGIFSDYYTPGGTTLFHVDGQYTTLWRGGGSNLAMGFDAYYPTLFNDTTANTLNVSLAGGVATYENGQNYVAMFTNVNPVKGWEIDAPDWMEYAMDTTYLTKYGMVAVQITAEAYTDGAGREGEFVITADDAVEYTIVVKQGTVTAIDQTKYLFDNKRYNLLGIEVDENYKGVVIRNGEKFIQ